mgnify:CR=1 FL=1
MKYRLHQTGKAIIAGLAVAALSACATSSDEPVFISMTSDPAGATVSFGDGTSCTTPCRVGVQTTLEALVARAGYAPKTVYLDRRSDRQIKVVLYPVGRSTPVEEIQLPDL